jgi:hypothetical protein
MECAGCLYNFVQMTTEPGKAVPAVDAWHAMIIGLLYEIYVYNFDFLELQSCCQIWEEVSHFTKLVL